MLPDGPGFSFTVALIAAIRSAKTLRKSSSSGDSPDPAPTAPSVTDHWGESMSVATPSGA